MRKIIRRNKVCDATDLSPSTIDRQKTKGEFPKRIRLSSNAVGWYEDEIVDWIESRPRGGIDAPTEANDARRKSEPDAESEGLHE
jgi:prophage regulatory protein